MTGEQGRDEHSDDAGRPGDAVDRDRENLPAVATVMDAGDDRGGMGELDTLDVLDGVEGADELSEKHRRFVCYYIGEARFNASRAAQMAGYKDYREGSRLLARADIRRTVRAGVRAATGDPTAFLARLADIALGDPGKIGECMINEGGRTRLDWDKARSLGVAPLIRRVAAGRGGDTIEFHDPLKAIEIIGRHAGWLSDRPEVSVNLNIADINDPHVLAEIARGRLPSGLGLDGPAGGY